MSDIPQPVIDVLKEIGETAKTSTWDCHGTRVILHKALEKIAAHKGMIFDPPVHLVTDPANKLAQTLQDLSSMEQRQVHLTETVTRAHKRIDEIQAIVKDEVKNHEKRIQAIEISIAKNQWIERIIMAGVMAVIGMWIKGGI